MKLNCAKYKILLHLEQNKELVHKTTFHYRYCQRGIAEAVNLSRSHASRQIRKWIDKGMIEEHVGRVKGLKRKRKIYTLSKKGAAKAEEIRNKLKKKEVTIKTNSSEHEIELREINNYIQSKNPLLEALNQMDENSVVDLSQKEERKEELFVGREKEMERLKEIFDQAKKNNAQSILVKGSAGIGKTRLINEFKENILLGKSEFLVGKGHYEKSGPYLPFVEAFEPYQEKKLFLLEITERGLPDPNVGDISPFTYENTQVFSKTVEDIRDIFKNQLLVIFIDDIHWADKGTLMLFHYLRKKLDDTSLLLIGAFRPEEVEDDEFFKDFITRMSREGLYEEMELEALKWEETRKISQGTLGIKDIPDYFIDKIHKNSGGNPLFLREIIKRMQEENIIDAEKKKFPPKEESLKIPKVVEDLIENRLENFEQITRKILKIGSVIGEEIEFEILKHMMDMEEVDLLEHIDILIGSEILEENVEENYFIFSHGLIQKSVYESIPEIIRKNLHEEVAKSIKEVFDEKIEEHYSEIAFHYKNAEDFSQAFDYYLKSGKKLEAGYAFDDAYDMYKKALKIGEKEEEEKIWKVLEKLGDVSKILGDYEKSLKHYQNISIDDLDPIDSQRIYGKIADVYDRKSDFEKGLESIEKGLENQEENIATCELLIKKGLIQIHCGDLSSAEKHLDKSLEICQKIGKEKDLPELFRGLGLVHLNLGEYEDSISYFKKGLDTAKESDNLKYISIYNQNLGNVYKGKGEFDKALEHFNEALEIEKKLGDKRRMMIISNNLGTLLIKTGELKKAKEKFEKSLRISRDVGDKMIEASSLMNIGIIYNHENKEINRAEEYYRKGLYISKKIGYKKGIALANNNIANIHMNRGNLKKAKKMFKKSHKIAEDIGSKSLHTLPQIGLVQVYIQEDNIEKTIEEGRKALETAKEIEDVFKIGICHRILGKAFREDDQLEKAKREFEKGIEILESTDDKKELGKLLYEYALYWDKVGEKEKKRKNLNKAQIIFEDFGLEIWREKCENESK